MTEREKEKERERLKREISNEEHSEPRERSRDTVRAFQRMSCQRHHVMCIEKRTSHARLACAVLFLVAIVPPFGKCIFFLVFDGKISMEETRNSFEKFQCFLAAKIANSHGFLPIFYRLKVCNFFITKYYLCNHCIHIINIFVYLMLWKQFLYLMSFYI